MRKLRSKIIVMDDGWGIINVSTVKPSCMYACMYVCMHACMHACMYVCMYVCMHVCTEKAREKEKDARAVYTRKESINQSINFYSAPSSHLLLRSAPNTARTLCWSFTPKRS